VALARFQLLLPGWRGYFIAWLSLVWIPNAYLSALGRICLDIKHERIQIASSETESKAREQLTMHRDGA
jgi:hypothetical protein